MQEMVEILDKKEKRMVPRKLVRVKTLSDFLLFVIDERKLDPADTETLIEIDGGGSILKFTAIIKQETERNREPLSTGVNKAFVVAALFDGDEESKTLKDVIDKIEIYECKCKYCNDLKVAARLCGLMKGWPMYPCP